MFRLTLFMFCLAASACSALSNLSGSKSQINSAMASSKGVESAKDSAQKQVEGGTNSPSGEYSELSSVDKAEVHERWEKATKTYSKKLQGTVEYFDYRAKADKKQGKKKVCGKYSIQVFQKKIPGGWTKLGFTKRTPVTPLETCTFPKPYKKWKKEMKAVQKLIKAGGKVDGEAIGQTWHRGDVMSSDKGWFLRRHKYTNKVTERLLYVHHFSQSLEIDTKCSDDKTVICESSVENMDASERIGRLNRGTYWMKMLDEKRKSVDNITCQALAFEAFKDLVFVAEKGFAGAKKPLLTRFDGKLSVEAASAKAAEHLTHVKEAYQACEGDPMVLSREKDRVLKG